MPAPLRGTFDTNVVLAAQLSPHETSPTKEILDRWRRREFIFLCSVDTLSEYAEKLLARNIPATEVAAFLRLLARHGEIVSVVFFHLHRYPPDADDIMFLLCALNGQSTHLVSYDGHLLSLRPSYAEELVICRPLEFLAVCRRSDRP